MTRPMFHRTGRKWTAAMLVALACLPQTTALARTTQAATIPVEAGRERPRNVLLIIADDLGNRLGNLGWDVRTPNIDRLASEGVVFDRAYAQFPWCAPSRASFLTGTRPDNNGVVNLWTPLRKKLPDIVTLPQYFRERGYFSGRVGKVFHQGVPDGIGHSGPDDSASWDLAIDPRGRDVDIQDAGKLNDLSPGIPYGSAMTWYADDEGDDGEHTDGKVASAAIEMLQSHRDKPFFIAVGFYRPHVPEVAPRKYFDLYPPESIAVTDNSPEHLAAVLPASRAWTPDHFGMSEDDQRQMIRAYYAATSFMDAQVGRIVGALDALGLADDTIVVFMSDHGFLLGEHGQWMKNVLWEPAARTPLIVRAPGMTRAGSRSSHLVELLDLYPTLTDLAALPHNPRNEGTSLKPLLERPDRPDWDKPAFSQVMGGRSVRAEHWRYTEWEGGTKGRELYDHRTDPDERRNLAQDPAHQATVTRLHGLLAAMPVERRGPAPDYDPVRDCLLRPLGPPPKPDEAGKPGIGRVCAAVDP